jgi:iron complex outermembrane receptor protein
MHGNVFSSGVLLAMAGLVAGTARAESYGGELADMSLEQLSNVVVTSVSRQEERLSNVAASIYIISAGEIRRSGVRTIPEALRLAPNLQVAQADARNYAVTARGFNNVLENKLLVLVDGRSIYSPLISGVFWDVPDLVMEDIERIEVISGPGATIWGANAVNGVINVITKNARDTQDGLASGAIGERQSDGALRYGGQLSNGGHYRVYGKFEQADDTRTVDNRNTISGWHHSQAGFRADWDLPLGALSTSGDYYQAQLGQPGTPQIRLAGGNLLTRLNRKLEGDADLRLQVFLDHTERNQPNAYYDKLDTLDLELQHGLHLGQSHSLIWGGGYRYVWDRVVNGPNYGFLPGELNMHWANVFAQDEIALQPNLKLTAGLKLEQNGYTGLEHLPSLRLAWNPAPEQLLWASLTRAIRAPSRIDRDLFAPTKAIIISGKPFYVIAGGPDFQSEVAKVAELGYRAQPRPEWSYSVTAFFSDYSHLRTLEQLPSKMSVFENLGKGTVRGVEMWGQWQPMPVWRLNGGLVLQSVRSGLLPGSHDASGTTGLATNDPGRHWLLRSSHDLSDTLQLDLHLRHSSSLPSPAVPAYSELDLQLLWKPRPDTELAVLGQNLLHPRHVEFGGVGRSEFERSLLLKMTKRF